MAIGRKRIPIDWGEFDKLCAMQCTQAEIAEWFHCSVDTIERAVEREHACRFAEYFAQKKLGGHIALRRALWQQAIHGKNVAAAIFLSKQHLGFADKVTHDGHLNVFHDMPEEQLRAAANFLPSVAMTDETSDDTASNGHC